LAAFAERSICFLSATCTPRPSSAALLQAGGGRVHPVNSLCRRRTFPTNVQTTRARASLHRARADHPGAGRRSQYRSTTATSCSGVTGF
jgi:hypothetical protein